MRRALKRWRQACHAGRDPRRRLRDWLAVLVALMLVLPAGATARQATQATQATQVSPPPSSAAAGDTVAASQAGPFQTPAEAKAQRAGVRIRELVSSANDGPVRVVGYGLVVGLDGTGDRVVGGYGSGHTVQSVANLLRRFGVDVPTNMLRTRNVAAVLVTAEVSPYLRSGGRFDVEVASVGDAMSLRGGVLWMTPLVLGPGLPAVATAQGPLVLSDGSLIRGSPGVETTARVPAGGVVEGELPHPDFATDSRLVLKRPNLGTATRIAASINAAIAAGTARVEDPGSIALKIPAKADRATFLTRIEALRVQPDRAAKIVIDGRDGTVAAGADMVVGDAVVSYGGITLTVGATPGGPRIAGDVRVAPGTTVQDVAVALHAIAAPPQAVAAIFEALQSVGALPGTVTVR